ncbi:MAG: leucine-rich repeat domain-containing protein, partial [Treponema sp.]|nr:leucine-rich repeat domain-containing protein [Treponema sp.]
IRSALIGQDIAVSLDLSQSTGLTTIKASTFNGSSNLVAITLPASVTSIEESAFENCYSLESVTLAEGLQTIGYDAFWDCELLKSITLPDSVTWIGSSAFSRCSSLETLRIPAGVTAISNSEFNRCAKLSSITVAEGNTEYKSVDGVVYSADGTTLCMYPVGKADLSFTVPDGVTRIGWSGFEACTKLKNVNLPEGLITIDDDDFKGGTTLESITIPARVTTIGRNDWSVFNGCKTLSSITVASGNTKYKSIDGVLYSADGTILYTYPAGKSETSFVIPETVKNLGSDSLNNCTSIESISIPVSLTKISGSPFEGLSSLKTVNYTGTIEQWCGISFVNNISNPLSNGAALYINGAEIVDLVIPDSITEIPFAAFVGCTSIKTVIVPNSVTTIKRGAFYKCSNLESVSIGQNVTKISNYAFQYCSSLTAATCSDTTSVWYRTSNSDYTGGTEIGAMSPTDTAANAKALASTASYYLYKVTE